MKDVKLAIFDFDETLIEENSLATLFKEVSGKKFLFPDALTLVLKPDTYRQGIKFSIKRRLYKCCVSGVNEKDMFVAGEISAETLTPINDVTEKLHELHNQEYTIWIITATPTLFVKGVVNKWNWPVERVIGTDLYKDREVYTGEFGEECMQEEKVRRIKKELEKESQRFSIGVAYGNLPVDIPMMSLAIKSYFVTKTKIFDFN